MEIRWSGRALSDVEGILAFVQTESVQAARELAHQLDNTVSSLVPFPLIGRQTDIRDLRVIRVRRFPYLIFYSFVSDKVEIVHVRHMARRPWPT